MYEFFRGRVAARTPARLVLDVNGVGYELVVPAGSNFPTEGESTVWAHLAVREDAHALYGFPDRETRDLFRLLLRVKGVGPTMGLSLLSGMRPSELVAAIVDEDVPALTRVKGVGRKTAEQILLDLRDKVGTFEIEPAGRMETIQMLPLARAEIEGRTPTFLERLFEGDLRKARNAIVGEDLVRGVHR